MKMLTVGILCILLHLGNISASEVIFPAVKNGMIKMPLIPFHVQKERKRRELGLPADFDDFQGSDSSSRRNRHLSEEEEYEVGGLYQGYGTHYVDVWVGSPTPQRQTVIVDTGSGTTAFPCSGCSNCGKNHHASPFFIEADSTSFQKMTCDSCKYNGYCTGRGSSNEFCRLSVSYQEGSSWSAYEAIDTVYLGGPHHEPLIGSEDGTRIEGLLIHGESPEDAKDFSFPMVFGCQTSITGLFITQLADGIMGLSNQEGSVWNQAYKQGVISTHKFSLCFSRAEDASKEGSSAGALTLGGTDTYLHTTPMLYVNAFKTKGTMHGVTVRKMYIMEGGVYDPTDAVKDNTFDLSISESTLKMFNTIVDSGTTDTYFPRAIADAFKNAFKIVSGISYSTRGFKLPDGVDVEDLPTIIIQLAGKTGTAEFDPSDPDSIPGLAGKLDPDHPNDVLLTMVPSHYIEYDPKADTYIPRFYTTESHGAVIGANAMSGHDFLFDTQDNGRIGIAKSDCDYEELLNRTDTPFEIAESPEDPMEESGDLNDGDDNTETESTDPEESNIDDSELVIDDGGETDIIDLENDDDSELDDGILDVVESSEYDPEESGVDDLDVADDQAYYDSNDDTKNDDVLDDLTAGIDDGSDDGVDETGDDYYDDDEDSEEDKGSADDYYNDEDTEGSGDSSDEDETTSFFSPASIFKDTSKKALGSLVMGALVFVMIALSIMAIRQVNWRGRVRYHQTDRVDEQNHELYLDTEMQAPRTID